MRDVRDVSGIIGTPTRWLRTCLQDAVAILMRAAKLAEDVDVQILVVKRNGKPRLELQINVPGKPAVVRELRRRLGHVTRRKARA